MALPQMLALDVAPYPPDPFEVVQSASNAPVWLWAASGSCCVLSGVIAVVALVGLVWLLRRRKK